MVAVTSELKTSMQSKTIDEQNELNYIEAFYKRDDMKDKSALDKHHLWLEDRGAATLAWYKFTKKDGTVITCPKIDAVNPDRYPIFETVHNRWVAEQARRNDEAKVKI